VPWLQCACAVTLDAAVLDLQSHSMCTYAAIPHLLLLLISALPKHLPLRCTTWPCLAACCSLPQVH
jgi:hypothetical protein